MDKGKVRRDTHIRRPVVYQEGLRFLKSTSMKGVPRIPKSEWTTLRVLWTVAVLCLLAFALSQVVAVVTSYLKFETYTATVESVFHPTENRPPFPSITICNKNALSSAADQTIVKEYKTKIKHCLMSASLDDDEQYVCRHLMSNTGLFQYIGAGNASLLGHAASDLIIDCQLQVLSGIYLDKAPCGKYVNIVPVITAQYFNCYRLTLPSELLVYGGFLAGVSLVLHLDNAIKEQSLENNNVVSKNAPRSDNNEDYFYSDFREDITGMGAILTTQHPDSDLIPFPSLDGIELSAGFSNKIHLKIIQHKRLNEPYGKCDTVESKAYGYLKQCLADCFQEAIEKVCNCVDIKWLINVSNTKPERFCESVTGKRFAQVVNSSKCAQRSLEEEIFQTCIERCHPPCEEDEYTQLSTMIKWPSVNELEKFYNTFIKDNRNLTDRYKPVLEAIECDQTKSKRHCVNIISQANALIANNFLEVSYHLSDHRFIRLTDMPKTSLPDVCSKVGGIFNLWSGLTVIVLLELGEMLYRIIKKTDCSIARVTAPFRKLSLKRNSKQNKGIDMNNYRAKYGATFGGFEGSSDQTGPVDV